MEEIINTDNSLDLELSDEKNEIIQIAEELLCEVRNNIESNNAISVPIAQLATFGGGISSLIPSLNTVTQTTTLNTQGLGLYQLANYSIGDTLKIAKNGNFWGAMKTATGRSKLAQLQNAGSLSATTSTVMPINPATMMIAVTLLAIDKKLIKILETQKQIIGFLEREKKAEIEADIETLVKIVDEFKFNWDNEYFVSSNHKMVLDIQRTALKNMNAYEKEIDELIASKQFITVQNQVKAKLNKLQDKFNYYRLSLYTYSLSSLLEIMLSGNFIEEYISNIRDELFDLSTTYRVNFNKASILIEKMSDSSIETNLLKGFGTATKGAGDLIGAIPFVKEGSFDELLKSGGKEIEGNAEVIEEKYVQRFASISNPGITGITHLMEDMIRIHNHTSQIYFDDEKIYLLSNDKEKSING